MVAPGLEHHASVVVNSKQALHPKPLLIHHLLVGCLQVFDYPALRIANNVDSVRAAAGLELYFLGDALHLANSPHCLLCLHVVIQNFCQVGQAVVVSVVCAVAVVSVTGAFAVLSIVGSAVVVSLVSGVVVLSVAGTAAIVSRSVTGFHIISVVCLFRNL